jgi:UDP-N-acetylglucosamine 2-epimerase (non-hydrolysing)
MQRLPTDSAESVADRIRKQLLADFEAAIHIVYVVGARPNFVKMAPVYVELTRRLPHAQHVIVHTGQHYDPNMSDIFVRDLALPAPDHLLGVGSGGHAAQTARVMERLEPVIEADPPDLMIVPGDVNSTLAAALVAAKLNVPLAHLEAGLRSFDRSMPEEINRIVADEFSEFLLVHSENAIDNLRAEGIDDGRIHFVGNTMIDTLVALEPIFRDRGAAERLGVRKGDFLLVTLHRPALTDGPLLRSVMDELERIGEVLPVVFPVHPRTQVALDRMGVSRTVRMCEPLGYLDFLSLMTDATGVLTDSGGVQEETTYLGIPCFTLRNNTERPVTITHGTNVLLGLDPSRIGEIVSRLERRPPQKPHPPLWDGKAAQRVADVLAA